MNKKKLLLNSLMGTAITSLAVGGVVLGAGFDSWEQTNALKELSKHEALKTNIAELKTIATPGNSSGKETGLNLDDTAERNAYNFVRLLDIIFNGDQAIPIAGPMWIDWNSKLSKLMLSSDNKASFGSLKFNDCLNILLSKNEVSSEVKVAAEKIIAIKPALNHFGLVSESSVGFIVGITFLSLTAIPLTTLFALSIRSKHFSKKDK